MSFYEIPLSPAQQRTMTVALGGASYTLSARFSSAEDGGWFLDISDVQGNPIACGLPMTTGSDLLAQLGYLGIPGRLWVTTDTDPAAVPTFDNLGVTSHLLFEPF